MLPWRSLVLDLSRHLIMNYLIIKLIINTLASDEQVEERPPDHVLEDDDEEGVAVVDLEHAHHVAVRRQPRQDPHLAQDVVQDVLCGW